MCLNEKVSGHKDREKESGRGLCEKGGSVLVGGFKRVDNVGGAGE